MSEDIQRGTTPLPREGLPAEAEHRPDSEYALRTPYPWQVFAAAVIWINSGGLALAGGAVLVFAILLSEHGRSAGDALAVVVFCGFLAGFFGLWCAALNVVGIQVIRGISRSTLWEGIGSIVLSVPALLCSLPFAIIVAMAPDGPEEKASLGDVATIGILAAAGLLAAGVLALLGRRQYERWRLEQKLRQQ